MAEPGPNNIPGVYVHVPFCSAICNYCNFNRGLFDGELKRRYVNAVVAEIRGAEAAGLERPDTLYFGGGTPSLLTAADVDAVIGEARASLALTNNAEITLEANPETVGDDALEQFRSAGVNRLSFGVQSFDDEELKRLGRQHSAERAKAAVRAARAAGFDNISLDLMMWLPGQRLGNWIESVESAIATDPEHLSLYILEVYPHLPLRRAIEEHGWVQESDEVAAEMYESAMTLLDDAGYEQYEISNVCRAGRQSRHNLKYWTDGVWLGFGPGAHSTARGTRWRNVSSTEDYVGRIGQGRPVAVDRRALSPDERLGDALFTGLRLNQGIDLDVLSMRYGIDVWERYGHRLSPFLDAGILLRRERRLQLTRQGMLMANDVMSVFV